MHEKAHNANSITIDGKIYWQKTKLMPAPNMTPTLSINKVAINMLCQQEDNKSILSASIYRFEHVETVE